MIQGDLFPERVEKEDGKVKIGHNLFLRFSGDDLKTVTLYHYTTVLTTTDLTDKVAKRIFVVEAVERGAVKDHLAKALKISRQTIHNYTETKKHFGLEGLVNNYNPSKSKSRRKQRELHADERLQGNKAEQLADIRQAEKEEMKSKQLEFDFEFPNSSKKVEAKEQPFAEEHNWEASRYAGTIVYIATLFSLWRWANLVMGLYGVGYKIFMVFLLMAAKNIRSIEQLKNVSLREAGIILGIKRIASNSKVWQWFYSASEKRISFVLLKEFFSYQLRVGLVGIWLWFVDGHLLPYTGNAKVRYSYYTQRKMPYPGRTNLVTCDGSGRIVSFEIQEGKGDLKTHVIELKKKWNEELPDGAVIIFDREGNGKEFFEELTINKIPFVTWEKNIDRKKLAKISDEMFNGSFEMNGKSYSFFEEDKPFSIEVSERKWSQRESSTFTLRRIYME